MTRLGEMKSCVLALLLCGCSATGAMGGLGGAGSYGARSLAANQASAPTRLAQWQAGGGAGSYEERSLRLQEQDMLERHRQAVMHDFELQQLRQELRRQESERRFLPPPPNLSLPSYPRGYRMDD